MKKPISIILNVLSITSAVFLLVFAAFCCYDWIIYLDYMSTYDFWYMMDTNALCMLTPSAIGLVVTVPNIFIATSEKVKMTAKIMTIVFAVTTILAIFLYVQPIDIYLPINSLF